MSQLPKSTDHVTLHGFAADRHAAAALLLQTRRTLLQRSIDGTDGQTYGRTPDRYIEPAT